MCVTTRQKRQNQSCTLSPVFVSGERIEEVNFHKVLGVTIDHNLSWQEHIANLSKIVSQKVFQLSKIKHFLNLNARKQFFYAHRNSVVQYASTL